MGNTKSASSSSSPSSKEPSAGFLAARAEYESQRRAAEEASRRRQAEADARDDEEKSIAASLETLRADHEEFAYLARVSHFRQAQIARLYQVFQRISGLRVVDDHIDAEEFAQALGLVKESTLLRRLFQRFNVTETEMMTFREFVMALSQMSPDAPLSDKIRFSFELYDLNHDQQIDVHELEALLRASLQDHEEKRLLKEDAQRKQRKSKRSKSQVHPAEGAGPLPLPSPSQQSVSQSLHLSDEDIRDICQQTLAEVDANGNGVIDFEEYRAMVERNPAILAAFSIDVDDLLEIADADTPLRFFSSDDSDRQQTSTRRLDPDGSTRIEQTTKKSKKKKKKKKQRSGSSGLGARCNPFASKDVKVVKVDDLDTLL